MGTALFITIALVSAMVLLTSGRTLEIDYDSGRLRRAYTVGPFRFDEMIEETQFSEIPIGDGRYGLAGEPKWRMMSKRTVLAIYDYVAGAVAGDMSRLSILAYVDANAASKVKTTYLSMLANGHAEPARAYARAQEKEILSRMR